MKIRAVLAAATLAATGLGLTACGSSSKAGEVSTTNGLTNLTVGYTSEGGLQIPSYVAADLGFFAKHGLNVKLVNLNSSTSLIPALTGGSVDVGTGDGAALCAGYLAGSSISVVGANLADFTLEGWGDSSVASMKDLAGKTVGVTAPGSTSDFALTAALQASGMSRNDVKVVYLHSIPATVAAMQSGAIQATFIVPPWGKTLDQTKFHRFYDTATLPHVSTAFAVQSRPTPTWSRSIWPR
jgi:NitT/TauT family transport system substrate-binding protein